MAADSPCADPFSICPWSALPFPCPCLGNALKLISSFHQVHDHERCNLRLLVTARGGGALHTRGEVAVDPWRLRLPLLLRRFTAEAAALLPSHMERGDHTSQQLSNPARGANFLEGCLLGDLALTYSHCATTRASEHRPSTVRTTAYRI